MCNPDNKLCHFILGGDSRYIHDIYAFRPAIFYKQIDAYIDNKTSAMLLSMEIILLSNLINKFQIHIGFNGILGDASEINHISDGVSIYRRRCKCYPTRNSINATVYVSSCRNILLKVFFGNELGAIIAERSSIIMKNAYFYANQNGNILITGQYNGRK